jgi:uncharacterized protein YndB with AHSA1/START domain
MSTAAVASDIKLQIHRTYNATPQQVFDAWTRPELIKEWFGPGHLTITDSSTDPRVGGAYRIAMEGPAHHDPNVFQSVSATGVYTTFDPPKLLAFTWNGTWVPGEETLVTVALTPVDGGTELLLTHERFLTEESRDGHNRGWTTGLDNMAKLFPRT